MGLHLFGIRYLESGAIGILQQLVGFDGERAGMAFGFRIECQPGPDDVVRSIFRKADTLTHDLVEFHEMLIRILVVAKTARFRIERYALTQAI